MHQHDGEVLMDLIQEVVAGWALTEATQLCKQSKCSSTDLGFFLR